MRGGGGAAQRWATRGDNRHIHFGGPQMAGKLLYLAPARPAPWKGDPMGPKVLLPWNPKAWPRTPVCCSPPPHQIAWARQDPAMLIGHPKRAHEDGGRGSSSPLTRAFAGSKPHALSRLLVRAKWRSTRSQGSADWPLSSETGDR